MTRLLHIRAMGLLTLMCAGTFASWSQCPVFVGAESIPGLPETAFTPHWFQCVGSVTADPAPFNFELTALPASHTGVVVDWGDGNSDAIGGWNGADPIPHTYAPDQWRTYTITVTTTACPGGVQGVLVYEPENPGAVLVYGDNNASCAPFEGFPKIDVNLAFSSTWDFSLDWGDGSAPDAFSMQDVLNDPAYDTLRFSSSTGDEIIRILGMSHVYDAQNCATGDCDHTLTLTYSNFCSVRGANTPFVPGGTIVGTGYKQALLSNAFLTWDVDEAQIDVQDPVICWPDDQTLVGNTACPNCCGASEGNNPSSNGTIRSEKWDFGAATYIGPGPDPTQWIDWNSDCSSDQVHLLSFPGPGIYTVTLFTQNHCGIDTVSTQIKVTPPPSVEASALVTTLCPGEPFQFDAVSWSADPPLNANDLSFNFTYGDGPYSITIPVVGGIIPITGIPAQPGHVFDDAGTYDATVQLFPTLAPTCADVAVVPVTVLTPPVADFSLPADTCATSLNVAPIDASTGAVDYQWSLTGLGSFSSDPIPDPVDLNGPGQFTFSLEVTSANGCTDTEDQSVTLSTVPTPQFDVSDACIGTPTVLNGSASTTDASVGGPITDYTWDLSGDTLLYGEEAEIEFAGVGSQSATLTVTTAAGCSQSTTQSFDILPRPGVALTTTDTAGCSPFNLLLEAQDTTGNVPTNNLTWYFGHGSDTSLDSDGTHTWPPNNGNDTVEYVVTVEAGLGQCADSRSLTVAVAPAPFVQTDGGEVCSGTPFTFGALGFNTGASSTWFWEVDNVWSTAAEDYGTITSDFEGFNYTFTNPDQLTDTVSVSVSVFRSNGCAASDEATLLVRPSFQPAIEDGEGCAPFLFDTPNQVALGVDWTFNDPSNPDPPGATAHLYSDAGTYTVIGEGTSVFGCVGSDSAQVVVFPSPTPELTAEAVLCAPDPAQPQRSDTPEDGAVSWTLQVDQGTIYPWNGSPDTTLNLSPGNHLLTLSATNVEGCASEAITTVLVQEEVVADFSLPEGGCEPVAFEVNGLLVSPGAVATWTIGTPFGPDTQTGTMPNAPAWLSHPNGPGLPGSDTTYVVTLEVVNPITGCTASHVDSVSVQPQPVGQLVLDGLNGCDVIASFSYTGTADSLIWDFGDPFEPGQEITTASAISHAYPNPLGTGYTAIASVTAVSSGCQDTDAVSFEIPAIVEADMSLPDTLCAGEPIELGNLSTGIPLALGTAAGSWTWTVGAQTLVGFEPTAPLADENLVNVNAQTNAVVPVSLSMVHPESGCSDSISGNIVVLGQPAASFILTPDVLFEPPFESNLIDLNQSPAGSTTLWNITGGGAFNGDSTAAVWDDEAYGTHTVSVYLDNFGCTDSLSAEVTLVPPPPIISFIGDTISCAPLDAQFLPFIESTVDSVIWSFGQGTTRTIRDFVHDPVLFGYFNPGTYEVTVTAYGPGGTDVSEPQTVVVLDQVNAGFSIFPGQCVEVGDVVEFTPNFSYGDAIYTWKFGDGTEEVSPNGTIVTHTYEEAGSPVVTLVVENALCTDSTSRTACIIEFEGGTVGVPSAFTPTFGGDGSGAQAFGDDDLRDNDVFFPQLRGNPIAYSFTVYNRWGEQIFHTADPAIGWNGHFQGNLCKQDVYVWRVAAVFLDGSSVEQAGDVTLIRR